jgi:ABC-type lipoprotein export system ATPase subunit
MKDNRIIKSFAIKGLFGTTDLMIPFEDTTKILIGENGLGKTQILNMIFYTLTGKFERLIDYSFDSISIEFQSNKKVKIDKQDIARIFNNPIVRYIIDDIGMTNFLEIRESFSDSHLFRQSENRIMRKLIDRLPYSSSAVIDAIRSSTTDDSLNLFPSNSGKNKEIITHNLNGHQILYFPTYRRVEEDLRNLGYDEEKMSLDRDDTRLIHFGMDDVDKRFRELTQNIERLSKDGLSKISSEILSQLVKGLPPIDGDVLDKINQQDIDIILARVGNQITDDDKKRIKEIVSTKEIEDKDHSLLYFLQKLINIYDQQRELDNSIKIFRDVCNKYLVNKKLIYDESGIDIYIKANDSFEKLQLSKLSSGEKQIISIFSKIYLAPPECKFIVLFDEPELSLSIFWQRELLPDIFNSGKCHFLLAVTHSPLIFENELDKYAIDLDQYLKPQQLKLESVLL